MFAYYTSVPHRDLECQRSAWAILGPRRKKTINACVFVCGFPDLLLNIANMFLIHVQWSRPPFISGCFRDIPGDGSRKQNAGKPWHFAIAKLSCNLRTSKDMWFPYFWILLVIFGEFWATWGICRFEHPTGRRRDLMPATSGQRESSRHRSVSRDHEEVVARMDLDPDYCSRVARWKKTCDMIQLWRITPHFPPKKAVIWVYIILYHTNTLLFYTQVQRNPI